MVDYASTCKLQTHPDWKWTKCYLDKPKDLMSLCKTYTTKLQQAPKFQFGIEVPCSLKHAFELDAQNGDTYWQDAIQTELDQINSYKTFRKVSRHDNMRQYTRIPYHFVFAVKFDLRRKARMVAGGNMTEPPKEDIYSGVVGMETIRLAFQIAAMNGLMVCTADIGNAYLYGSTCKKVYVIAGPKFGDDQGSKMIIDKGLYGLRSSGARFHEHLARKLRSMGFTPSKANSDLWIKDCQTHYEYVIHIGGHVLIMGLTVHDPKVRVGLGGGETHTS